MASCAWSAENATKALLHTLKMEKMGKRPNVAEFIAAIAAGNSAQLIVMAYAGSASSTTLALGATAYQTGGRAVCILPGHKELQASRKTLGEYADLLSLFYGMQILCYCMNIKMQILCLLTANGHKQLLQAAQRVWLHKDALLVGYNAIHSDAWMTDLRAHFSPLEKAYRLLGYQRQINFVTVERKAVGLLKLINSLVKNMFTESLLHKLKSEY